MRLEETVMIMKAITNYYSQFSVTEEMVKVWHDILREYPFQHVAQNLRDYVRENKFPPTIADLVKSKHSERLKAYVPITEQTLLASRDEAERKLMSLEKENYFLTTGSVERND